jgi:hypothetical protein
LECQAARITENRQRDSEERRRRNLCPNVLHD